MAILRAKQVVDGGVAGQHVVHVRELAPRAKRSEEKENQDDLIGDYLKAHIIPKGNYLD